MRPLDYAPLLRLLILNERTLADAFQPHPVRSWIRHELLLDKIVWATSSVAD
jgi:hypothetical protein